jgi:Tol biopolymer transport system component
MVTTTRQPAPEPPPFSSSERLDSWKEIAAYLKRDESTVRRWEKEGLPIHRRHHKKRAAIFAYKSEIDAWWHGGRAPLPEEPTEVALTRRRKIFVLLLSAAAAAILIVVLTVKFVSRFREDTSRLVPARITQVTTLPGLEYSPTWSPDGRCIAYASNADGNLDIYIQELASGQTTRLTDSEADDAQPAWSPDGSRIAFVSARAHPEKRLAMLIGMSRLQSILPLRNGDVWVTPARGGIARRIAENAYDPAWSPDGKKIIYAAQREGEWGLWIREVDAPSPPRRLAVVMPAMPNIEWTQRHPEARFRGVPLSSNPNVMIQPAWSPDGKWIAFTGGRDPFLRVFVVTSEGGEAFLQTEAGGNAQMPSWSPEGRSLFFSSERNGRINLYGVRFEPGQLSQPRQITAGTGADLQPRLDVQGTRLAYSSVGHVQDLWEYDLKSGQATALTSETTDEDNATPSPDGAWLAFVSNRLNGRHLWLLNRRTGGLAELTTAPNSVIEFPRWTWDGRYLLYRNRCIGTGKPASGNMRQARAHTRKFTKATRTMRIFVFLPTIST